MTSVEQVGTDRILELQFSDGRFRLFLEFYAGGNIILTDNELKILALLRTVTDGAPHEHVIPGATYNLSERQNINGVQPLTEERVRNGLRAFVDRQAAGQVSSNKKLKKKAGDSLRKALATSLTEFPPMLIDHSLRGRGFDVDLQPEDILKDQALMTALFTALQDAVATTSDIMSASVSKGYIFGRTNPKAPAEGEGAGAMLYDDYHPFQPKHLLDNPDTRVMEIEGFNKTVDEFYSSIEGQKLESKLSEKEEHARKKIENARRDQEKRLEGLQDVQALNVRKAGAIEANIARVEETTAAINGLIAQGKDWDEIEKLIQMEKRRGNAVAEIIRLPLKLSENTATLMLGEWEAEAENDEEYNSSASDPSSSDDETSEKTKKNGKAKKAAPEDKRLKVDIDLGLSPWANAREYYDQKRTAADKEERTAQASAKALKSTERKVQADLNKALKQEKQVLRPVRQPYWFEKFIYFLSSDGYMVIGAKDGPQSDIMFRKHLKKGDVFVHADLDGAAPLVIKNKPETPDAPIPPTTLSQAGNLSVSTSTAWDSKAVMSAWWVSAENVSKKAPTGDVMGVGKFHIKAAKNFLPPAQLLLGFAVMFLISEESKANHFKHRVQDEQPTTASATDDGAVDVGHDDVNDEAADEHGDGEDEADGEHEDTADEEEAARSNPLQPNGANEDSDDDENEEEGSVAHDEVLASASNENEQAGAQEDDAHEDDDDESDEEEEETASVAPSTVATDGKIKGPIPVRGKKGKRKKIAAKYANQDEEDRAEAMRMLGSASGQQKAAEEAAAKEKREKEAEAARQRRRQQHEKRAQQAAAREQALADGGDDEDDEAVTQIDLGRFVGTPRPGDNIVEALPVCAPWGALGRYKYKAKLQPGTAKKGKAVREILGKWSIDSTRKGALDESAQDTERIWPREIELVKAWKDAEVFGVVPVSKVRVMMSGASASGGGGGKDGKKGGQKQKPRSGKGSKKQR